MRAIKTRILVERPFLTASILSFVAVLVAFSLGLRKIEKPKLWKGKTEFNAQNAYDFTRMLATGYKNRLPWRPEHDQAVEFIKREYRSRGLEPQEMPFSEVIGGKNYDNLKNIYAIVPGREVANEYIVVLAHFDITDTTTEGATDDASGVGTMLELARIFAKEKNNRRSLVFLATDSEEYGAFWGAHHFAKFFPQAKNIVAGISLDFVAPDTQEAIMVLTDGLKSGYTPLWLREIAISSVEQAGTKAEDTKNALEFVQRALLIPPADHGALLMAGIPSFNFFGKSTDFAYQMSKIHHTPLDNMEHLKLESFIPYGRAAEIALRSVDRLPRIIEPAESFRDSNYLKLTSDLYVTGPAMTAIQYLIFFPFLVQIALMLKAIRTRNRSHILRVIRSELRSFTMLLTSLFLGYFVTRVLPELKIITKYEMFPATQKSPLLNDPEYFVLLAVALLVAGSYFFLAKLFGNKMDRINPNPVDLQIRHTVLGTMLAIIIFIGLSQNPYLASTLLIPPAYLWMLIKVKNRDASRAMNVLLFIGGLVSLFAVCIVVTFVFHLGVFYWYLFLALSYGLISIYAAILALAVVGIGIRILRNTIL